MKFCLNCKYILDDDMRMCPYCGKQLSMNSFGMSMQRPPEMGPINSYDDDRTQTQTRPDDAWEVTKFASEKPQTGSNPVRINSLDLVKSGNTRSEPPRTRQQTINVTYVTPDGQRQTQPPVRTANEYKDGYRSAPPMPPKSNPQIEQNVIDTKSPQDRLLGAAAVVGILICIVGILIMGKNFKLERTDKDENNSNSSSSVSSAAQPDNEQIAVPNLITYSFENAKDKLSEAGLNCVIGAGVISENAEEGTVVAQEPAAETIVKPGDAVTIHLASHDDTLSSEASSAVQEQIYIEDYTGQKIDDVKSMLEAKNVVVNVDYEQDSKPKGTIISQNIKDTNVNVGNSVSFKVSSGSSSASSQSGSAAASSVVSSSAPTGIYIGDYTGQMIDDVKKELESKGVGVKYSYSENNSKSRGTIIDQSIKNTTVNVGNLVSFTVSSGITESQTPSETEPVNNESVILNPSDTVYIEGYRAPSYYKPSYNGQNVSGTAPGYDDNAVKFTNRNCWAGQGAGSFWEFVRTDNVPQRTTGIDIVNGNIADDQYYLHGRIKKFRVTMTYSNGRKEEFDLSLSTDSGAVQQVMLNDGKPVDIVALRLTVLEVTPGDNGNTDACMSLYVPF